MPSVMTQLHAPTLWQSRTPWILIAFAVVAPLSCFQSLDALKYTSSLSIVFIIFLVILVVLYSQNIAGLDPCADIDTSTQICQGSQSFFNLSAQSLKVFSIFIFGFTCQHNTFAVTNELINPTQMRMDSVFLSSISTAVVLYLIIAIFGYSTYGNQVTSDLLKKYPNSPATSVARIFVSLIVAFHYPLQCNPGRKSALSFWKKMCPSSEPLTISAFRIRYITITTLFLGSTLLIALTVEDLGVMLSVIGATGSTIVGYVIPSVLFLVMHRYEPEHEVPTWKKILALTQLCIGLAVIPLSLTFIFMSV